MAYIADALQILTVNTAHIAGGSEMKLRWADLIKPKRTEHRSPSEIADRLVARMGLKRRQGGE